METPSSATLLRPRLRAFRRSPSPHDADTTPQPGGEDELPTPRMHPRPIAPHLHPAPTETPAARLRALLAREPRSPRSTTPAAPSAPPSEADSAADPARFGSSTSSVTRGSLKDIFSRALREPGDTPEKGRPRRNSFDGSSMEITPVVGRNRGQRKPARRSVSDEEAENPKSNRRSDPSFRSSTAVTLDNLRSRLVSSQSQLMDQNFQEALYDQPSLASMSTSNFQKNLQPPIPSSQLHPARIIPPVATITPLPSFHMSSQLASQSNLLEQDSEMQRAMGDVLNSESEASASTPYVAQNTPIPSNSRPSSSLNGRPRLAPGRTSYELDPSTKGPSVNGRSEHPSQEEEPNHQREREWNRPRIPSGSGTPEIHPRHSQEPHRRLSQEFRSSHSKSFSHESVMSQSNPAGRSLERRGSLASLRSFDDDHSSRPSSIGSQADYRDRISDLEQEKNHDREREWNKRHPSRPSSSLSSSSNHSSSHSHSHPPRSPSAVPYLTPTHSSLQRKSSRTSLRSDSPASLAGSNDSLKNQDQEEKGEVTHERERNWNSPRPHWSIPKSPSASYFKTRSKVGNSLRASSSLTRLGDSNGHQDTSRVSTKLQSASPKADVSLPVRPDSGADESAIGLTQSSHFNGFSPGKTPAAASKFGWNFARSPLPPLELDDPTNRHQGTPSPTPDSRPSSGASEAMTSSHTPVRSRTKGFSSIGHATSDMSLTHVVGDESSIQQGYQNGLTAVIESRSLEEPPAARTSWSQEDIVLASDEEPISDIPPQSTTPKSNPPFPIPEEIETDTETEVLTSPSPPGSPQFGTPASIPNEAYLHKMSNPPRSQTPIILPEEPSISATPPGTPPSTSPTSEMSPSFALLTPPRPTSFGSSILDFRTPSPPHDLPDLPGPPSSSDDDALGGTPKKGYPNLTLTKTPKPPGAWAATPLPSKFAHRPTAPTSPFDVETTPPASTSTPLPRANTYPRTECVADDPDEDGLATPAGTFSRARSLPSRTPVPPGAWVATPGQSALLSNGASQYGSLGRKRGPLKVRFDVAESETSATEGQPKSPISAIRLANPELPSPKLTAESATAEVAVHEVPPTTSISHTTPERPTTPTSRENAPSPRSLRKSPTVRHVDAYGRERADREGNAKPLTDLPSGYADAKKKTITSPPTPRRSLVRIVDAMGREVDDAVEIPNAPEGRAEGSFEADVSVVSDDSTIGHAEALARMRKTLKDLAESLSDADRSDDLELNSSHIEQLEDVSHAARLARNQLAHNLELETAKQSDLKRKLSPWTRGHLPAATKKPWNAAIIYCGVIIQVLLVLAMWRYAHAEARRLFYMTYYDPLYPEFTPIQGSSCFSGTLPTSRSWTLIDSYETIRQEGWWSEILRAMRHVGDHAWERWGEHAHFEKPT